jgi:hypothetical protein
MPSKSGPDVGKTYLRKQSSELWAFFQILELGIHSG